MKLSEVNIDAEYVIESIEMDDMKLCIRLMELGVIPGAKIVVKKKSILKKTLLIIFNSSCFTIKDDMAKLIKVRYV